MPSTSTIAVASESNKAPQCLPITSEDTTGSSVYTNVSLALFLIASFTSSTVTLRAGSNTKSTTEPVITGTRSAFPSNLPFNCGKTKPTAAAAQLLSERYLQQQHVHGGYKYLCDEERLKYFGH